MKTSQSGLSSFAVCRKRLGTAFAQVPHLFASCVWLSLVTGGLMLLALVVSVVGATPVWAGGTGGSSPNAAYVGPSRTLTPQELAHIRAKEAAVAQWIASNGAYTTRNTGRSPLCVVDPSTGQCVYHYAFEVSGGGEYTIEPSNQPNWCGAGSGTSVAMHWEYNTVVNFGSYTVRNDPRISGGNSTYTHGEGWMAWFAQGVSIPQYSRTGVVDYPYENGTNIYVLQTGLDDALGTSYYIVADGNGSSDAAAESSFFGNATYDIGHDGRPMIFLVNAPQLPEWSRFSGNINHYVTGYEYSYWSDENNSAHNLIYYADSASTSDGVTAGDYSVTYDTMWSAEKNSDGYWVDQSGYHSLLVV